VREWYECTNLTNSADGRGVARPRGREERGQGTDLGTAPRSIPSPRSQAAVVARVVIMAAPEARRTNSGRSAPDGGRETRVIRRCGDSAPEAHKPPDCLVPWGTSPILLRRVFDLPRGPQFAPPLSLAALLPFASSGQALGGRRWKPAPRSCFRACLESVKAYGILLCDGSLVYGSIYGGRWQEGRRGVRGQGRPEADGRERRGGVQWVARRAGLPRGRGRR
jgi:hypothetical protein